MEDVERIVSMTIYDTVTMDREHHLSLAEGKTLDDVLRLAYNLALENSAARAEIARLNFLRQREKIQRGEPIGSFEPPWEYQGPRL